MKGLILAAGVTKPKYFPWTDKPKCLLKYEGEPILEHNVKLLKKHGIKDVTVVVGYEESQVREFAKEKNLGLKFVYNPDFSDRGSIDSLILGLKDVPPDDVVLLVLGDVFLSEEVLSNLLKCEGEFCVGSGGRKELCATKLSMKTLGDLADIKKETLRSPHNFTLVLGFYEYLRKHGAEEVEGDVMEIDYICDLSKRKKRIPMFYPFMPESVIPKLAETLRSRWIGQGPKVDEFEKEFATKFGLKHVVAVNSGTSALRLAYAVAGVGLGDEVVTPALTCTATNTPILEQFAKPVFADVQYETANLDPSDVLDRITGKTKAIVCVHWGGYPCNMNELREIAETYDLPLIADGAHALGAEHHGKPVGQCADFTMFSLQAIKHITTGDGGMLAVKDKNDYKACMRRRWFGIDRAGRKPTVLGHDPTYDITEVGYKYHMNDIAATIGLEQLKYFDQVLEKRRQISRWYREELEGAPKLELFQERDDRKSACWLFTVHVKERLKFAEMMWKKGVEVSVGHWRNDKYTVFGSIRKDLPNTDRLNEDMICIPLHNKLTDEDVNYVIKSIKEGW